MRVRARVRARVRVRVRLRLRVWGQREPGARVEGDERRGEHHDYVGGKQCNLVGAHAAHLIRVRGRVRVRIRVRVRVRVRVRARVRVRVS